LLLNAVSLTNFPLLDFGFKKSNSPITIIVVVIKVSPAISIFLFVVIFLSGRHTVACNGLRLGVVADF
jgi:hypothetical protein